MFSRHIANALDENLKTIIAQLRANNQVTIRYVDRPNCLRSKEQGDLSDDTEKVQTGKLIQKCEDINTILNSTQTEEYAENYSNQYLLGFSDAGDSLYHLSKRAELHKGKPKRFRVCHLDTEIEYFDTDELRVVKRTRSELCERKASILDIIKKSQQVKKKERCWGKIQSIKKFTLNAKQKILEAGSVVDMHTEKGSQYELTLTVPGSGVDVYDAVARYSGYIVNRMTQVIRRLEAKGVPVYWFFVWEHQKRGALHMHWCIAVPGYPMVADYLCRQLRAKWFNLLHELSEKTHIDLFKKRGFSGTWRNNPEMWQSNIAPVRKSVAAYFSKYLSKNCETSRFNRDRREKRAALRKNNTNNVGLARVVSLCPSRYWGCGYRVKHLCKRYRVDVSFRISSRKEGDFVSEVIREWIGELSPETTQVSRTFKKVASDTGFIYCKGWEQKIWFESAVMEDMLRTFKRLRSNQERKKDGIGALLAIGEF